MPTPPEPVLRAAVRWLELLPSSGVARARAILTSGRGSGGITATQYETAYDWLARSGLLQVRPPCGRIEYAVLEQTLISDAPLWFRDADLLVRDPDELPADAVRAAEALGLSLDEAYACVISAWGRVDAEERKRIGDAGELALAKLIEESTTASVEHVASYSDGLGYDLLVRRGSYRSHIEVKSTTRRNRLSIYLSRTEFETMLRDADWQMVAVLLDRQLKMLAIGTVSKELISASAPADTHTHGRWESFRLDIPAEEIEPGFPRLATALGADPPGPLLTNAASWRQMLLETAGSTPEVTRRSAGAVS
ncbi:DUF3883 domain-containing protein [Glycomyces xiaoerkulensis]|uniref:DUF3883 domain-containing protein n=1 Tax=Glycomyces xiaoerkulensis TaxID=2038139 RepID=UPI000C261233|nr:DUF3883 domain-containing protein [Glycomyces xiaoerkulensis]